jgi:hypothetical protein
MNLDVRTSHTPQPTWLFCSTTSGTTQSWTIDPSQKEIRMDLFETPYGFKWGVAEIKRYFSDDKKGWLTIGLETPYNKITRQGLQIYVTKTGKVRVFDSRGEWKEPKGGNDERRG